MALVDGRYPTVNTSVLKPMVRPSLLPQIAGYKRGFNVLDDERQNSRPSKYRQHIRLSAKNTGCLDVDWSTDGCTLLILAPDGLRTVDAEKEPGREDRVLSGPYISAKLDPTDSQLVAGVTSDGKLVLMRTLSEGIKTVYNTELDKTDKNMTLINFTELVYSPTGTVLAISTANNSVFTFSIVKTGLELISLRTQATIEVPNRINAMQFDVTGEHLWIACGSTPGKIWRYKFPFRNAGQCMMAHQGPTLCLAADRAGKYFVSGGADGLLSIWDANTAEQISSITKPDQAVIKVSINYDSTLIAYITGTISDGQIVGDTWFYVANVQTRQVIFGDQQRSTMFNIKWCPRTNRMAYFFEEDEVSQSAINRSAFDRYGSDRYRTVQVPFRHAHIVRVPDRM